MSIENKSDGQHVSFGRKVVNGILTFGLAVGVGGGESLTISATDSECANNKVEGKKFYEVVNWHDEGHTGLKGSIYDLYPVYLDKDGKIIEEGEVSGYYWVMGADGKRVYYPKDPCEPQGK